MGGVNPDLLQGLRVDLDDHLGGLFQGAGRQYGQGKRGFEALSPRFGPGPDEDRARGQRRDEVDLVIDSGGPDLPRSGAPCDPRGSSRSAKAEGQRKNLPRLEL